MSGPRAQLRSKGGKTLGPGLCQLDVKRERERERERESSRCESKGLASLGPSDFRATTPTHPVDIIPVAYNVAVGTCALSDTALQLRCKWLHGQSSQGTQ